jgi:hypothetical protein
MSVITPKQSTIKHVNPGTYLVTCVGTEDDHIAEGPYGARDVVRLFLQLDGMKDDEGQPIILDGIANRVLSPKSTLWGWVQAFGFKPEFGVPFDTDVLAGHRAQAVVLDKPSKDGSAIFSNIDNIVPLPQGMSSTPATSAPAPAPAPTPPAPTGDSAGLSTWWASVRAAGMKAPEVTALSKQIYGAEPKDLTAQQRIELMAKAKAGAEGCTHEPTYTDSGDMVCIHCGEALDESTGQPMTAAAAS